MSFLVLHIHFSEGFELHFLHIVFPSFEQRNKGAEERVVQDGENEAQKKWPRAMVVIA